MKPKKLESTQVNRLDKFLKAVPYLSGGNLGNFPGQIIVDESGKGSLERFYLLFPEGSLSATDIQLKIELDGVDILTNFDANATTENGFHYVMGILNTQFGVTGTAFPAATESAYGSRITAVWNETTKIALIVLDVQLQFEQHIKVQVVNQNGTFGATLDAGIIYYIKSEEKKTT